MSVLPGYDDVARAWTESEALRLGATRLGVRYAGEIAARGPDGCFLKDENMAKLLGCHKKSLPRLRPRLALQGVIRHERLRPGAKLPKDYGTSSHGATLTKPAFRVPRMRSKVRTAPVPTSPQRPRRREAVERIPEVHGEPREVLSPAEQAAAAAEAVRRLTRPDTS